MDEEEEPPDNLRYNGEGKKNCCIIREHAEDSFEASNCNTSRVITEIRIAIVQLTKQANPIDLSGTAHPQLRALNLRHDSDVHSRSDSNQRKKSRVERIGGSCTTNTKTGHRSATLVGKQFSNGVG